MGSSAVEMVRVFADLAIAELMKEYRDHAEEAVHLREQIRKADRKAQSAREQIEALWRVSGKQGEPDFPV